MVKRLKEFCALGGDASYLWPRWILLRGIGLVYVLIFAGIINESRALIGPGGLAPIADLFGKMQAAFPHSLEPFILAPSLFWLGSGQGMITALQWAGLAAAVALTLNLWPRMALFACWLLFLSFVSAWSIFSPAQLDDLMLEAALLAIPFAPSGLRPGLGAASPPRPIAVFTLRWLLFRVMFESGIIKIIAGDPHWRDLTAMDVMHEMAPFPTILGYLDHQLPHAWHLGEIALTFAAEIAAPLVALCGGRRGRWGAFWIWAVFQTGIQLTSNFGWLNLAAIALGFILLDDQMLEGVARRVGRRVPAPPVGAESNEAARGRVAPPCKYGLRAALGAHFYLTLCYFLIFARIALGLPVNRVPGFITGPANLFWNFHSANEYNLYATIGSVRTSVEFAGSNDAGRTWRAYEYKYVPQRVDRICPFLGPWFPRFETTIRNLDFAENKAWLFQSVAAHLIAGDPAVTGLFPRNPFPGRPPTLVRMRYYRLSFTDYAACRRTGHFWRREDEGDYLPLLYLDDRGQIAESDLTGADAARKRGDDQAALAAYEAQYRIGDPAAGFKLADMLAQGRGLARDPSRALAIYRELADRGENEARNDLGLCYEFGRGVPVDCARAAGWYRSAAEHDSLIALYNLGALSAKGRISPPDDLEGLVLLREASALAVGEDATARYVRRDPSGYAQRLEDRLPPGAAAAAEREAARRVKEDDPLGQAANSLRRSGD